MSKYVIIHGQLREISDDELMHYKYIKREKVNGKWRYYYKDTEFNDIKYLNKGAQEYYQVMKRVANEVLSDENSTQEDINNAGFAEQRALSVAITSQQMFDKAKSAYEKSAGYKLVNFLNKTSNVANKAKKWVSNLFGKKK